MDLIVLFLIIASIIYAFLYIAIWKFGFLSGHVDRYGPLIALKTENVGFFDYFRRYKKFFEAYGLVGVFLTVIIGTIILLMLIFFLIATFEIKPAPVGVYAPQNIFLIPGLNEFIPATIAVLVGIVIAVMVHEFGHAILCRVRDVKLKSTGIILAVIPIGAFVDPNNEEMEKASIKSRVLIYGAGITNNLVIGVISLIVMMMLISVFVGIPSSDKVVVYGVDSQAPGYLAGMRPGDWIKSIDGIEMSSGEQYIDYIQSKKSGDLIHIVLLDSNKVEQNINVILTDRPDYGDLLGEKNLVVSLDNNGNLLQTSPGYLGISGINFGETLNKMMIESFNPVGILRIMSLPVMNDNVANIMKIVVVDTSYKDLYGDTFYGFWSIIHVLFWIGWMNINIGLFNALPMIPLDGGYIMKDGLKKLFGNTRYIGTVSKATTFISIAIVSMIILIYLLPHIFSMM